MSLLPRLTDYTDKDFDSLLVRIRALIRSAFPEWSDENVANFGNILTEAFCHIGDVLCFNIDSAAAESRLGTATQRRSLLALAKLIGFAPATAAAAEVTILVSIPGPLAGDVPFVAGDYISTAEVVEPVRFRVLNTTLLHAGATTAELSCRNSDLVTEQTTSTGLANQEVVLSRTPYLDNSLIIVAANGAYIQVRNFLDSDSADLHFVVVVDQSDRAHVRFGSGVNGTVPVGVITFQYETGGGERGNVPPGVVTKPETSYTDTLGNAAQVTATNILKASGGADRMSNAQIKSLAPEQLRAPVNSVAREDFEINARRLPQVARALFLTRNQDPAIPENAGTLYVIPKGGGAPSVELKALALYQITTAYPCTLTFTPSVADPVFKTCNVQAQVYLRPGASAATTKAAVVRALTAFFALNNPDGSVNTRVDFGANIVSATGAVTPSVAWSDIFGIIAGAGVRKVDPGPGGLLLNGERADLVIGTKEFPQLGSVTLYNAETGGLI
jgi:hypothetical protein